MLRLVIAAQISMFQIRAPWVSGVLSWQHHQHKAAARLSLGSYTTAYVLRELPTYVVIKHLIAPEATTSIQSKSINSLQLICCEYQNHSVPKTVFSGFCVRSSE